MFSEARPLVDAGRDHILSEPDLIKMPDDQVPPDLSQFESKLNFSSPVKLVFSNLHALGAKFYGAMALNLLVVLISLVTPVFVNQFIKLLSFAQTKPLEELLFWGVMLVGSTILQGVLTQHYFYHILGSEQISTRVLNRRVYQHALRLSHKSRGKTPVGDVVNHMSTDSDGVSEYVFVFSDLFENILTTIGVSALLFYYLGWTAVVPLLLFFILVPLTKKIAKRFTHLEDEMMKWRDHRVSLMTQILNAIRIVKYFVWEKSVYKEVDEIRQKELSARKRMAQTEVMASAAYTSVSSVVLFSALGTHVLRGQTLDVALIFTSITLFGLLEGPLGRMSNLIARSTTTFVGARRLLEYFAKDVIATKDFAPVSSEPIGISASQMTVSYDGEETLKDINLNIRPGESVAVVGPVGSGKSTLLLGFLRELPYSGIMNFWNQNNPSGAKTRRAFCPQEAFITNGTLSENLSFGEMVTDEELRWALKITALEQDLKLFPAGLNTEIGEKGVNLSGGQKQRVALARAYLSKPGIVFLDDPLSAVDVETEKHIVSQLLFGDWKKITRIVATHRMESLPKFDKVVFIVGGRIQAVGKFEEIMSNKAFADFYSAHHDIHNAEKSVTASVSMQEKQETHSRITEDEEREVGAVKSRIYWDYVLSLGGVGKFRNLNLFLLFFGSASVVVMPLVQKWWLSTISARPSVFDGVLVYGVLGLIALTLTLSNGLFWLKRGVEAGRYLHNAMLKSILGAPIRFFDSTPVGRILQRFSRDVESVDVYLQWTFDSAVHCFLQILVTLTLIVFVLPSMILIMAPMLVFYYFLQRDYRRPAREIKRLDSLARSPRYAHFKETLMGLTVIRGFDKEQWFIDNFKKRLVKSQETFYNAYILNRWFSVRVPILGGLIAGATMVVLSMAVQKGFISAGVGGLLTVYSMSFWGFLNWGIRVFSDIETRMTSVERLKFYSNLPQEKGHSFDLAPAGAWPEKGELHFQDVKVRYAPHLPLVLKGVTFSIKHGERIGLIGRTGSGKSTLLQTLFRFVDLENGKIILDGRGIHDVTLPELRRSLAIIPQDPVLFMGTIRSNLDRYEQFTDDEVKRALIDASMWSFISSLPLGLQTPVNENGSNFSQGQRQLLCLARALLVKARVVALDEATASVDVQTDVIIQKVIREKLKDATLLIIAHRLGTVMDCDRIIEMSQGEVKGIWNPKHAAQKISDFGLKP